MFLAFRLVELLHIHRFGFPVDAFDFRVRLEVRFLHLQGNQSAGQRHHTYIMSRSSFNSHHIALFKFDFVTVAIISLPGVLKLYLNHVTLFRIARYIRQPIVGVQLFILSGASFAAKTAAPIMKFIFHSVYILIIASTVQSSSVRSRRIPF